MADLTIKSDELDKLFSFIEGIPSGAKKAGSRAINRSLPTVRKGMIDAVREDYNIKVKDARSELTYKKANYSNLTGSVVGRGAAGIPLIKFVTSKRVPFTRRLKSGKYTPAKGVPVLIRKDKGKIPAKGVFVQVMASGHIGAFRRSGKSTLPIEERFGPSPISILSGSRYDQEIDELAATTLKKNLLHEAEFLLRNL